MSQKCGRTVPEYGKPVSSLISTSPAGNVFRFFDEIVKIPRPSGHEEKIRAYLLGFASSRGLDASADRAGNVIIRKPASPGHENAPCVILQGHMDMVCEKETGYEIDFENDPISAYLDEGADGKGGLIRSVGTTLGADDGAGVALILDVLDSDIGCGPVEAIFTVDEEAGCTGAAALSPDSFDGKYLINLDWEEDTICLGCAGSVRTEATFDFGNDLLNISGTTEKMPVNGLSGNIFRIVIDGLRGGHSGAEIHLGRANAIKILAHLLLIPEKISLLRIEAGNLPNAIPRHAEAVFMIPHNSACGSCNPAEDLRRMNDLAENIRRDFKDADPDISVTITPAWSDLFSSPDLLPLDPEASARLLRSLSACPTGVVSADHESGMIRTSINLASVRCCPETKRVKVATLQRSLSETSLNSVSESAESAFILAGASVSRDGAHPGWTPDRESFLLKKAEAVYEKTFGTKPAMTATHAGLECGVFLRIRPDLEMISIGPTVTGEHTPDETLSVSSVEKMQIFLRNLLISIGNETKRSRKSVRRPVSFPDFSCRRSHFRIFPAGVSFPEYLPGSSGSSGRSSLNSISYHIHSLRELFLIIRRR